MIRRPPRSTLDRSSTASDVYKRQGVNITTGSNNIAIGYNTTVPVATASNQLNIANIMYSRDGTKLGIFNNNPQTAVEINGDLKIGTVTTGLGTDSNLVISNGVVKKILATGGGGSGWNLTGNAGTDTSLNYVGTIDAKDLLFKIGGTKAGVISMDATKQNTSCLLYTSPSPRD